MTFAEERERVERRRANSLVQNLCGYTQRADEIRKPFLAEIRRTNARMKEALQDAHLGWENARVQIDDDYKASLREIEQRERASTDTTR